VSSNITNPRIQDPVPQIRLGRWVLPSQAQQKVIYTVLAATSAKKIGALSWVIVGHYGIGVSWCLPGVSQVSPGVSRCLLVSPGVIGACSFPPGGQFSKYADAARYALDLPGLHKINPIPNVHFLTFFRDVWLQSQQSIISLPQFMSNQVPRMGGLMLSIACQAAWGGFRQCTITATLLHFLT